MLMLVREHDPEETLLERDAEERRRRGVTFRELAAEYLEWLEHVQDAKPSTLRDHRLLLAEPGQAYRRGRGSSRGQVWKSAALTRSPGPTGKVRPDGASLSRHGPGWWSWCGSVLGLSGERTGRGTRKAPRRGRTEGGPEVVR
jgi:hypothetical protein